MAVHGCGLFLGKKPYFPHLEFYARSNWRDLTQISATSSGFCFFQFKNRAAMEDIIEEAEGLSTVASGVGIPLYTDKITKSCSRLDFARVCVMLDYNSTLPKHLVVMHPVRQEGQETPLKIDVEYEWLPQRCKTCCTLGHTAQACMDNKKIEHVQSVKVFVEKQPITNTTATSGLADDMLKGGAMPEKSATPLAEPPQPILADKNKLHTKGKDIVLYNTFELLNEDSPKTDFGTLLDNECTSSGPTQQPGSRWNMIKVAAWNVRGLNGTDHQRAVEHLVREHHIQFLGLIETRVRYANVYRVRQNFLRNWSWFDDYSGPSGVFGADADEPWLVLGDFNAVIDDSEGRSLWKRLDRMLVNEAWLDKWPNASYISALPSTSDHSPLIIHSEYSADNVKRAKGFLDKAQELFTTYKEDYLLHLVKCCRLVYCQAVKMEEIMLHQCAKLQWLKQGDQNTKAFFRKINATRIRQRIFQISTPSGVVLTNMNEVTEEFVSYFKTLLGGTRTRRDFNLAFLSSEIKHCLTEDEADLLCAPITVTEIKDAIFDITEDSAPGPDGYTSAFFKAAWSVVGQEVSAAIGEFFTSGKLLKQINATLCPRTTCRIQSDPTTSQVHYQSGPSKSYDLVQWDFLLEVLKLFKFPTRFIGWIEQCVSSATFSVSLNGSIYGFFPSARGLRQGDPMSPYLFVLVMEIWSTLLRYRVRNAPDYQFHWKCTKQRILSLCFADDILLFCRADIPSIRVIKHTLSEFAELSGLKVNPNKSQIILSRAVQQEKQQMIDILDFQEGSLPGSTGRGCAKVSWDQICRPKEEGGLGFHNILVINKALMLKHLWKIVQNDRHSIWVDWILHHRLRNNSLWTFNGSTGSWGWKKIIKLRPVLQRGLIYQVGNGSTFKLWQDIWHQQGPLSIAFPRGPEVTGWPLNSFLSRALQHGHWSWPNHNDPDISEIVSQLPLVHQNSPDTIMWRHPSGQFSVKSATELIQPPKDRVVWHGLLQGRYKIPRHNFILWLAILEKLSTLDKHWISRGTMVVFSVMDTSRALLAALVYYIWIERNNRKFTATSSAAESVARRVIEEVRLRILSDEFIPSLQTRTLYRIWKIAWPIGL
ncbi:putative ribonuclease H protein [Sesamum angolense]|uniref:Ribonuclease H protein n=1 Tax=Sesamum angolense TaxID=2727404 RepID=A0AAE1XHY7_9LAMI|nr:putative ribonuclease H protein [Sesamum angolense]